MRRMKVVCVSGYFEPLHIGHIMYLKDAKCLGDKLVLILNNDLQKKRRARLSQEDRIVLCESIRYVDEVVLSVDVDDTVSVTLRKIKPDIFAKGVYVHETERAVCEECGIEIVTNVGQQLHLQDILSEFQ